MTELNYELAGSGPAVVLIHSAVADSRMWDEQVELLSPRFTVLRYDLRGFGDSPLGSGEFSFVADLRELLDSLGIGAAAVVGNSVGGRVALEFALEHPDRVTGLVLVGAGLPDHDWAPEVRRFGEQEDELVERGEIDAAVQLNLDMWALPHVHDLLRPMQRRAFEAQLDTFADGEPPVERNLDPPASARLAAVRVPTLVVVGEHDVADIHRVADRLVSEIPDARLALIGNAKHLPSLERPDEFNRLLLEFLEHGV